MKRRVVITGLGVVTPIGSDVETFWSSLVEGKSGIGPITRFDTTHHATKIAAEIKDFDPLLYIDRKNLRRMGDFTQYAYAAAMQAVQSAKLTVDSKMASKVGVTVGSGTGGQNLVHENLKTLWERGPHRVSPYLASSMLVNTPAGEIAIAIGAKGPSSSLVTACATASSCIGEALRTIQHGTTDVMIAGGTEGDLTSLDLASFSNIKALSKRNDEPQKASRPFDKDRDGFVIGAGAGIVVLEELTYALERGAPILAELVGYGATTDAYHITAPDPSGSGPASAIRAALDEGELHPEEVQYVNAHGTSTRYNDQMETLALKTVFGDHSKNISVSSNKSMIGHLMGAAGAVELISTIRTLQTQIIPPTINLDQPDEGLDLDYVPHVAKQKEVSVAISNSFGFGGHNVCLALRRWEG